MSKPVDIVAMRRAVRELASVYSSLIVAGPATTAAALIIESLGKKLTACLDEIEELRRHQCS